MTESVQNTKEILREKRNSLRYVFEKEILDENIKQYIFGAKGYSDDAIRETNAYPNYFNNILSLAFYFVYACYRCDLDNGYGETENLSSHNAKRIKSSLENALVRYPITMDLIQFVLTDIQFELAQGEKSELKRMFKNLCVSETTSFNFNSYFAIIEEYNKNPSRFQYSKIAITTLFLDLVNNLSFLKDYNLVTEGVSSFRFITRRYADKKEMGISKSESEKYDDLPIEHLLFRDDSRYFGGIYRLFSIETGEKIVNNNNDKSTTISLRYFTPNNERSLQFSLPREDGDNADHLDGMRPDEVYEEIVGDELPSGNDSHSSKINGNSIDQVHTVNYKYIKNLALAISDAISSNKGSEESLHRRFWRTYPYIFEHYGSGDDMIPYKDWDWDSIIIMLLIESSPTIVLEHVIRSNKQMFFSITENLYKRIYDVENLAIFNKKADELEEVVHELIDRKFILGESSGFGRLPTKKAYGKLFPRAAAMLILSKLNDWQENDSEENLIYTGNLQNNIILLQKASKEYDVEKCLKYACIVLGETVKHTISFYAGLFAYGKAKAIYDSETKNRSLNKKEIEKHQKRLEGIFLEAAKRKAESLPTSSATDPESALALIDLFIDFCKKCTLSDNVVISDASKNLHAAVGKYEVINIREFERLILRLKKLNGEVEKTIANEWVAVTLDILEYFKTGGLRGVFASDELFDAIYPFTAVFNKRKENLDGYKTVNFSLNIDVDDDPTNGTFEKDINVLSEFVYDRSEVYYCLPNILRSNRSWWIDPVLISFREFNNIFSEIRKDNE